MNSRERVRKVLNHELPDRVPVDLAATRTSGISAIAYNRLKKTLGLNTPLPKMYDMIQQLVYPDKQVLDLFNVDFIDAGQAFTGKEAGWKEFLLRDGSSCLVPERINLEFEADKKVNVVFEDGTVLGTMPPDSIYIDQAFWLYGGLEKFPENIDIKEFNKDLWEYTAPPPGNIDVFKEKDAGVFIENIKKLYYNTQSSIVLRFGGNLIESGFSLRGMENYLCDLYLDEIGVNRFLDLLMENYLKKLMRIIELAGDYIDVLMFADDMGDNNSSFFSPEIYCKYFKHRHKEMWDLVHEKSNIKVFLHTCGSVYELLPDLIEAGMDILNPVQTNAKNMQPEKLKKEFGKHIIFWGGCVDTRKVLVYGSPEDVEKDVGERIEILGKNGGGLVFNQIHNILADVPAENIIALFKAAEKYGQY